VSTVLIRNADCVATFDDDATVLRNASVRVVGNRIDAVGPAEEIGADADEVIDARGCAVLPGLVNTHHHFFQTLTRNLPAGQDAELFDWLVAHYPVWARLNPESVHTATQLAMAELLLSGCTTAADHTYIWPNGARVDDQVDAARNMGMRFHAARGSMSVGESGGGLPPDSVVEDETAILTDCERVIQRFHDPGPLAMTRVVLAPCSPFSVSPELMRETARLARYHGVHMHTHLAETRDETDFCRAHFGCTPVEYAEDLGWVGEDVWFAHMVHPAVDEVQRLGGHRCGVAHCPSSNMRLGSGIARVGEMHAAGMRVGLGVDGSASNDGSSMLVEARQAMLLQRVAGGAGAMSAYQALWHATRGGAAVLGRDDIGQIAPGKAADIVGVRLDTLPLAGGAVHDPLAALLFCLPRGAQFTMVDGRMRVRAAELVDVDAEALIARHNHLSLALVTGGRAN
jgi:cytosine/adenosine deaminase-related metal-dependent hydrolase